MCRNSSPPVVRKLTMPLILSLWNFCTPLYVSRDEISIFFFRFSRSPLTQKCTELHSNHRWSNFLSAKRTLYTVFVVRSWIRMKAIEFHDDHTEMRVIELLCWLLDHSHLNVHFYLISANAHYINIMYPLHNMHMHHIYDRSNQSIRSLASEYKVIKKSNMRPHIKSQPYVLG